MNILNYYDEGTEKCWMTFKSREDAQAFLNLLPGYRHAIDKETGLMEEWLDVASLPTYQEIEFNGHIVPITKFMFRAMDRVDLFVGDIPCLSDKGEGITDGMTLVDAYSIPNDELRQYIESREHHFAMTKEILEEMGLEVVRTFQGSEDGEAICYRKRGDEEWHFLGHMDPIFADMRDEEVETWVHENL